MVPEARLLLMKNSGTLMFNKSARDFIFRCYLLNFRRKKAPTKVEAFLHHSLLLEIIMVPEAGLEPARLFSEGF